MDTTYDFSGVDITGLVPCSPNCSQQLTVGGSVTGTCENPGAGSILLTIAGSSSPYLITPLGPKYPDPSGSTFSTGTQIYSGLINGSYNFQVTDQIGNTVLVQYIVEGCVDTVINSFSGTTCGAENGSITYDKFNKFPI